MKSSYSIFVLMIAMITTNIVAHVGELDLGLKWGDILRSNKLNFQIIEISNQQSSSEEEKVKVL